MFEKRAIVFKKYLILFFIIFSTFAAEALQIPTKLVIKKNVTLRSQSYFSGKSYVIGFLTKGVEAEILEVDTNKSKGVGLKIKITSGPNFGRIGWIYYHKDPQARVINLYDQQGKSIAPNQRDFKKFFTNTSHLVGLNKFEKENEDQIWDKIRSGEYQISTEDDQGGAYVSYKKPMYDSRGIRYYVIKQTPRRLEKMHDILDPSTLTSFLEQCNKEDITDLVGKEVEVLDEKDWLPHCKVLARDVSYQDKEELGKCLQSIKDVVIAGNKRRDGTLINRSSIFTNLFLKLNPKEQEFAALTLTAFGEAGILTPPLEEMVAVMKVVRNRRDYARKYGHETATDLDAALQPWQFSMYNNNDHNWKTALSCSSKCKYTRTSVEAFIKFKNSSYKPPSDIDNVYHYHREYVTTATWSHGRRPMNIQINDVKVSAKRKRHNFYKDVAWSFKLSSFRKKADDIRKAQR